MTLGRDLKGIQSWTDVLIFREMAIGLGLSAGRADVGGAVPAA